MAAPCCLSKDSEQHAFEKGRPMEVALTLLAQTNITAEDEESYEDQRDELISKLEEQGFAVSIENESSDDFEDEEFYMDRFDDEEEDDDEDEDW